MLAGSQLSDLGALSGTRLAIAILGGAVALGGIAFGIRCFVDVLTPETITLTTLAERAEYDDIRKTIAANREVLWGTFETVEDLREGWTSANEAFQSARSAVGHDLEDLKRLAAQFEDVKRITQSALVFAGYENVRRRFLRAVQHTFWFGLLACIGIGSFAWAAHPAKPVDQERAPLRVSLQLSAEGRALMRAKGGAGCVVGDRDLVAAIAITQRDGVWQIVTIPTTACEPVLMTIGASLGEVRPQLAPSSVAG